MNIFSQTKQKGTILIQTIVYGSIAVVLVTALVNASAVAIKSAKRSVYLERSIQIAEAGIDYYRWHLAHAPTDFQDGTGVDGPYVHDFNDENGVKLGEFILEITPPPSGSTVVVIKSTGTSVSDDSISRTIQVTMAIPSFAKYAVVANDAMRFGEGTEVYGPIHVNGGVRFDGLAHNVISSALEKYDDPDHAGGNEFGVHTHVYPTDPLPPADVPDRTDVFEVGRQFPLPAVDFVGLTTDLAQMKADAISDGKYFSSSGRSGYHITLKTNNTFDVRTVRSTEWASYYCTYSAQDGWGTWSIRSERYIGNYPIPDNGIIFFEDHVWVDGQIDGSRVTIAAGRFPDSQSTRRNITVNNDLLYTDYDGNDVIALIAQNNINVGLYSENDLQIDGALIAQNGRVGRHYYSSSCGSNYVRSTLTLNGMIATNIRYGFSYTDNTGYQVRNLNYDANLLYSPPPSFPLTSDQYEILKWQEVK